MDRPTPKMQCVRGFCRAYGIDHATFYRWMKKGLAPATLTIGGHRYVTTEAEREWLARHASTTTQPVPSLSRPKAQTRKAKLRGGRVVRLLADGGST